MSNEAKGRLAISVVCAVVGAIAFQSLCEEQPLTKAIFWWLVYALTCGVVLNTRSGLPGRTLLLASCLPAAVPVIAALYPVVLLERGICFSGNQVSGPRLYALLAFFFTVSAIAVYLFSFIRFATRKIAHWFAPERLQAVESVLRGLIGLLGVLSLLYATISSI